MMSNTVQGQEMMEQARNRRDELEQIVFHVLQKDHAGEQAAMSPETGSGEIM